MLFLSRLSESILFGKFLDNILHTSRYLLVFDPFESNVRNLVSLYLFPDIVSKSIRKRCEFFREQCLVGRCRDEDIRIRSILTDLHLDDTHDSELLAVFSYVFEEDGGGHGENGFCESVGFGGHKEAIKY